VNYRYEIDIKPVSDERGGGYMAVVPDLPGCKSDGNTREEALRNVYDAIDCWIEAAQEMGRSIPQPSLVDA
jgi:antitoxin HicB